MSLLERDAVKKVRQALTDAGQADSVVELAESARSAEDAAASVGCELGAIVKSLVFTIERRFVMALVAGDHRCIEDNLSAALNMQGSVKRPQASEVKGITGFTIGGVAPIGLSHPLPMVIDRSLKRFETIYAAAGHPHCVFATTAASLSRMTGGIISASIAEPLNPDDMAAVALKTSRTFASGREKRQE
ncbi:MAG: YbaK/EbsC family protein [Rhodospirillaceae bacterium]|jgi:prolyl-tRNA editing enzyme YbaK/EbsC (Cys-tRNA(Pro) deacylase)|nr:YbaK/EbsC family protein [Rhodospirillaceae bacterium]